MSRTNHKGFYYKGSLNPRFTSLVLLHNNQWSRMVNMEKASAHWGCRNMAKNYITS